MINRNISEYLSIHENQTTNYNKDVILSDLEGNTKVVVKCYCTIVAYKSISFYMEVVEEEVFVMQKELIQAEIDKFKEEAYKIAQDNNVPII